jgi:hypothetical protein
MNKHFVFWYALIGSIILLGGLIPMILDRRASFAGLMTVLVVAIIAPTILIWVAQRMGYPLGRPVLCPNCGTEMPLFRQPTSVQQGIWGGYTCPKCGTEMDATGRRTL